MFTFRNEIIIFETLMKISKMFLFSTTQKVKEQKISKKENARRGWDVSREQHRNMYSI